MTPEQQVLHEKRNYLEKNLIELRGLFPKKNHEHVVMSVQINSVVFDDKGEKAGISLNVAQSLKFEGNMKNILSHVIYGLKQSIKDLEKEIAAVDQQIENFGKPTRWI